MGQPRVRIDIVPAPEDAELVERKGLGHPDTICDALAEELSRALSRHYLERFGAILHHNVDKALLVGGRANARFGGGELLEPIEIHLAGRAVTEVGGERVPLEDIARRSATEWLSKNLRGLEVERDVKLELRVRPGSADLGELFRRAGAGRMPLANDTSIGVGFAPLSSLEALVLEVEQTLNAPAFRDQHPEGGEDVKVMGRRDGERVSLTIARAFVSRHLRDLPAYQAAKERVREHGLSLAERVCPGATVAVNASDAADGSSIYLTLTGLSAESGDDGQVGRGNRVNGLITPHRPMSLEAAAGKNPVSHVGKLYNLAAQAAAHALCRELEGVRHAEVFLVSCIGRPIDQPELAQTRLALAEPAVLSALVPRIEAIIQGELAKLPDLALRLVRGELGVY